MSPDRLEAFNAWIYEIENYSTRYERFRDDLNSAESFRDPVAANRIIMRWLRAAFEQGAEYECQKTAKQST